MKLLPEPDIVDKLIALDSKVKDAIILALTEGTTYGLRSILDQFNPDVSKVTDDMHKDFLMRMLYD